MTASVIEVRFKGNRLDYFQWPSAEPLSLHDPVIVEVERGQDLGRVSALGDVALKKCGRGCAGCSLQEAAAQKATHRLLRRASREEVESGEQLRRAEEAPHRSPDSTNEPIRRNFA